MLALAALLAVIALWSLAPDSDADREGTSYGSVLLPYGGVTMSWDGMDGGADYYVIEKGWIFISFEGHDAKGLETTLAGSGLTVNHVTSEIYGELENTIEITIEGKSVRFIMVAGTGSNLPIYGIVAWYLSCEPSSMVLYLGQSMSQYVSIEKKIMSSSITASDLPKGLSASVKQFDRGFTISGTPKETGEFTASVGLITSANTYGASPDSLATITIYVYHQYTVKYDANEGSCNTSEVVWKEDSSTIYLPEASRTDYNFLGWYTQSSGGTYVGTTNDEYTPSKDVTLYAHWEQKNNPVTSISITGSSSVTKGYSTTLTAVSSPTSASDRHVNWTISSGSSYISLSGETDTTSGGTVLVTGKATGTAVVKATARDGSGITKTFTITVKDQTVTYSFTLKYNAMGGSGAPTAFSDTSTYIYYDTTVSTVKPTKSGYDFLGWGAGQTSTVDYAPGDSIRLDTGTTQLFAIWKERTTYWYLSYDAGLGSGAPSTQSVLVSENDSSASFTISSSKPTRDGFTFAGWSQSSGSSSASFQPGGQITVSKSSTTLYAVWNEVVTEYSFTLYFDMVGGYGGPGTMSFVGKEREASVTIPTDIPYKSGYNFMGWGESSGTSTVRYQSGETFTMSTGAKTLFAVWKQTAYVLVLNTNGADEANRTLTGYGASGGYTFTIPSDFIPSKSGYTFSGWSTSISGPVEYSPGDLFTCDNGTLYAIMVKNVVTMTYTVTYDLDGGSGAVESQSVTVSEGTTAKVTLRDTIPTKSGYDFLGWSDVKGSDQALYTAGEANVILKSLNTVLYAVWSMQPVTYILTYNGNASDAMNVPEPVSKSGYQTCTFVLSSKIPEKDSYIFVGWSLDKNATSVAQYAPGATFTTSDTKPILYAVWALATKTWILAFDANGGSGAPDPIERTAAGSVYTFTIPDGTPTMDGYTFVGWSTSSSATSSKLTAGTTFTTANVMSTLYAVWQQIPDDTFKLTYNLMGGADGPSTITATGHGEYKTIIGTEVPTKESATFLGWSETAGGDVKYQPGDYIILQPNVDTVLYAKWSVATSIHYTLTFDANGGEGGPEKMEDDSAGECWFSIPTDVPTKDGYSFAGWSKGDGTNVDCQPGDRILAQAQDTVLKAVWQGASEYRLSFNLAGGYSGPNDLVETDEPSAGHEFKIPSDTPARDGYEFVGWATYEGGPVEKQPGESYSVPSKGTYYLFAVWKQILIEKTYWLLFDANGGTGGPKMDPVTTTDGTAQFKIPADRPEREGFAFLGWSDTGKQDNVISPGAYVYVTDDNSVDGVRTLKAVWVESTDDSKVFQLILDPNGGLNAPLVDPVTSGDESVMFTIPLEVPTREGFTFLGWSDDAELAKTIYKPGAVISVNYGDVQPFTLYAIWQKDGTLNAAADLNTDGAKLTFDASGSTGFSNVLWTFGDGHSSRSVSGEHTYESSGQYTVKLAVYNSDGKVDSISIDITIVVPENTSGNSNAIRVVVAIVVSIGVIFAVVRFAGLA